MGCLMQCKERHSKPGMRFLLYCRQQAEKEILKNLTLNNCGGCQWQTGYWPYNQCLQEKQPCLRTPFKLEFISHFGARCWDDSHVRDKHKISNERIQEMLHNCEAYWKDKVGHCSTTNNKKLTSKSANTADILIIKDNSIVSIDWRQGN